MSLVKCWSWKVLVDWMYLKFLKWIDWRNCMLPYIAYDVKEVSTFEHIYGVRRHPKLHIYVSRWLILPIRLVCLQLFSDSIVLVFSRETGVAACLESPPFAEGSGFKVVDFGWPVPRHVNLSVQGSEFIVFSVFPPKERESRFDWSKPPLSFFTP